MKTLTDVLKIQQEDSILQAPDVSDPPSRASATPATTQIALRNTTSSSNVYAYVSGLYINNNNALWLLQSDGSTGYFPTQPAQDQSALQKDVAIKLGAPGTTRTITVPQLVGGRVWFSKDTPLTFKLNRGGNGAALVEPSVTNPSDAAYDVFWDFVEFTYNSFQLFANITYVDFVSIPTALRLESTDGSVQNVLGLPSNGLDTVCAQLQQQQSADGAPWGNLVVRNKANTANLRALSPNNGIVLNNSLFSNYWQPYVDAVWNKYAGTNLTVDTQVQWGALVGRVSNNLLNFTNVGSFPKPSARDIFSCSTGAFANYTDNTGEMANIGTRLAAAFNRSTLLSNPNQPTAETVASYYKTNPTNHYSRILHSVNLDHRGYAFPYDDVSPSSEIDQAGAVASQTPKLMTVFIGGGSSTSSVRLRDMAARGRQQVGGRRIVRRDLGGDWASAEEEKEALAAEEVHDDADHIYGANANVDVEKGLGGRGEGKLAELSVARLSNTSESGRRTLSDLVPSSVARKAEALLARLEASPVYARLKPVVDVLARVVLALLSLSVKAVVSRVSMLVFLVLFYLLLGPISKIVGSGEVHELVESASS